MTETNPEQPMATVTRTRDENKPISVIDFGSLGNFKIQGWEPPHPDFVKGGFLGLQVKAGLLTRKEAHQKAFKLDWDRIKNSSSVGPYSPRQREFAQEALSLVIGRENNE